MYGLILPYSCMYTGTPLQNNTAELWSLINFIEPSRSSPLASALSQRRSKWRLFSAASHRICSVE